VEGIMSIKPYYKVKKKEMSPKVKVLATISIFLSMVAIMTICMFYNIGPMNEVSAMYYETKNPTYKEMISFIRMDDTDENEYTQDYRCGHFAADVILNARKQGINAGFVIIKSENTNHAIVVFQTTDNGLQFLEPQSDVYFHETKMNHYLEVGIYYVRSKTGFMNIPIYDYRINWFFEPWQK
jgi:hypothetical protein